MDDRILWTPKNVVSTFLETDNQTEIYASAFGGGAGGTAKSPINVAAGGWGATGGGGTGKAETGTAVGGESVRWHEGQRAK